jgi:predicted acylesterase/phospholipase RssA
MQTSDKEDGLELVLGAGGVKGYLHIGLLRAVEELGLKVTHYTGVSVGSIVATLAANGWTSSKILKHFLDSHDRSKNPLFLASAFAQADLVSVMLGQPMFSLESSWKEQVKEMGISPQANLRIVACDSADKSAFLFEGTDYDLGTALSASGSFPAVFRPVRYQGKVLVDGAVFHRNPDQFCKGQAIVSQLGFATRMPEELLDPISAYFHYREVYFPFVRQETAVDTKRHVLIEQQADDVCGLSFGLSKKRCQQMYEDGYKHSKRILLDAIKEGKITCSTATNN